MAKVGVQEDNILLCGRWFTEQELEDVKYIVRMFPNLSRHELANTICEGLSWVLPNGNYKIESCYQLLEKLEKQSEIVLPQKREYISSGEPKIKPGPRTKPRPDIKGSVSDIAPIELEAVLSRDKRHLWDEYVERYHILGYRRPFGAHQRYFIRSGIEPKERLGCLLFSASAWALAERDKWIGWEKEDRSQRLHLIVNNSRFLIFPWVKVKNLASKALSLAARQVPLDWLDRYGFEPVLLETFVDAALYQGTCYQAANWIYVGETAGRGRMDRYKEYPSSPKKIYMYPLRPDFRDILLGKEGMRSE
ncbi:MAG: DUF4338 domain-containing protein [bacterium]|jgi:hypothetical protein